MASSDRAASRWTSRLSAWNTMSPSQSRPSHRSDARMFSTSSELDRSRSVSSTRRSISPPVRRASSQLNSAARALPTWRYPVGEGAKRSRGGCELTARGYRATAVPRDGQRRETAAGARPARLRSPLRPPQARLGADPGGRRRPPRRGGRPARHRVRCPARRPDRRGARVPRPVRRPDDHGRLLRQPRPRPPHRRARRRPPAGSSTPARRAWWSTATASRSAVG